jgi:hypothetical protein
MADNDFKQQVLEEFVRLLGFDNLSQYNKLVFTTDVSTPEKLAAFEKWQEEDGTKAGLLRLRGDGAAKSGITLSRHPSSLTPMNDHTPDEDNRLAKEIVLIDDKAYGLPQIKNAIPRDKQDDYTLLHFPTFATYRQHIKHKVWLVLLDFSLDLDPHFGSQIAAQVDADIIIGFSSKMWGSEVIIEAIAQQRETGDRPQLFAIQKLKEGDQNEALNDLFSKIL